MREPAAYGLLRERWPSLALQAQFHPTWGCLKRPSEARCTRGGARQGSTAHGSRGAENEAAVNPSPARDTPDSCSRSHRLVSMTATELACVDGRFQPAAEATIPVT